MKKLLTSSVLAMTALAGTSTPALADLSANVGYASEYYFRGIKQKESSASGGIDYENSGFYIGTWAADVGDGLEIDGYLGYGMEFDGGFSASVGFTTYQYTGDTFDSEYNEFNLNLGYDFVSLEYSVGTQDEAGSGANAGGAEFGFGDVDYSFIKLTVEKNGFYASYGDFGKDSDGDYFEFGYGAEVGGFDLGVAAIFSSDELSDQIDSNGNANESEALIFTLGKTFDL